MRALQQLIGYPMPKNIDEIIKESIRLRAPFQHFATIIIQDQGIIQGISQSKRNNLILDNFGILLAEMFTAPSMSQDTATLTDILNASTTFQFYGDASANDEPCFKNHVNLGTLIQVGSGTTAAARADYKIETALGTAPEDDVFNTGSGSYAAGAISVAGAISAGGTGTINETLMVIKLHEEVGSNVADIALFHDILVSGEAYTPGQTITCAYTINL